MQVLDQELAALATSATHNARYAQLRQRSLNGDRSAQLVLLVFALRDTLREDCPDADDRRAFAQQVGHGLPLLAVNRVGFEASPIKDASGIRFWGSSFVAGPQGEFLARANDERPELLVVDVDLARSEHVRRIWPFLRDRRIDAYGDLLKRFRD